MATVNEYHFYLPLQSEGELRLFIEKAFGVVIPDVQVCPEHTTPWRAFADAYFARAPVTVWKASRGFGGKSFLLALLGLVEAVTLRADVSVLGGSGEQSANVLKYVEDFWNFENAPREFLASEVQRETRIVWGNTIKALMASQASVRGPHRPRLRLDEVDEMALDIFDAAMGQTMAKVEDGEIVIPAQTVASSTHQYADGTMTEVLRRAGKRGWPVYEWCYRESGAQPGGWLLPSEVERKRTEVTTAMWAVEYDLQEPAPESRAIQPAAVEAMFRPDLGKYRGANQEHIEIEPPVFVCQACGHEQGEAGKCQACGDEEAVGSASYSTGADWARKRDWTIIKTLRFDISPARVVAFERCGRLPWPVMVEKFDRRLERYPGKGTHDGTGLGDVVDSYLHHRATAFMMVGRARQDLLTQYIAAIERREIVGPRIDFAYNEHRYATVDDVYGSGHLPDSMAAGALAWHGARRRRIMFDIV